MCDEATAPALQILPLGRRAASDLAMFAWASPCPVWRGAINEIPSSGNLPVIVVDNCDSASLAQVATARRRWADGKCRAFMVVLGTTRWPNELDELARGWRACVVAVASDTFANGYHALARAALGTVVGLLHAGLVCCALDDLCAVLAAPAVGTFMHAAYSPGSGASWRVPDVWRAPLQHADRTVVTMQCTPATTFDDIDRMTCALQREHAEAATIFRAAPETGLADVAVVAVTQVRP
jgi:hypothetical protein